MSDVVKCKSCGSVNNLPEGKTSMYCAYCGNAIEKKETNKKEYESVIKTKPEISQPKIIFEEDPYVRAPAHTVFYKKRVEGGWELHDKYTGVSFYPDVEEREGGGELKLTNKGIRSINEVTDWFTDNELETIKVFDLSRNKISTLNLQGTYHCVFELDLSNNPITKIESIPVFEVPYDARWRSDKQITIKLVSTKITEWDKNVIEMFYNAINGKQLWIDITGGECKKFITELVNYCILNKDNLLQDSFLRIATNEDLTILEWEYIDTKVGVYYTTFNTDSNKKKTKANSNSGGKCYIATATMGSYDHPVVMELRQFRDEWILNKSWGKKFVKWYYRYGAIVADFIKNKSILKLISYLLIVKPLLYLSRIIKK